MDKDIESDCSLSVIKDLEGEYKRLGQVPKLSRCSTSQSLVVWISVCSCKSEAAFHHIGLLYFRMLFQLGKLSSFAAENMYGV